MPHKLTVNQRVRDLITDLGYGNNIEGFHKKYFGGEGRSEKLRNVVKDVNLIKTDFIVEIAEKIAQVDGKKPNLHWVLTGLGEMYIQEDDDQRLLINTQREFILELKSKILKLETEVAELRSLTRSTDLEQH